VRPGDWIALPPGPAHAHQMVNSSAAEPLVYLCVSTMHGVEIVEYPDSAVCSGRAVRLTARISG
jgi:uncharacterized cupin superfamily protein